MSARRSRGCLSRQTAEYGCGQKAISGQITRRRRTGHADRGAARRKQVRKDRVVVAFDAAGRIDHETALGMKQRAGDLDRVEWGCEMLSGGKPAAISIVPVVGLERLDFSPRRSEGLQRDMHGPVSY